MSNRSLRTTRTPGVTLAWLGPVDLMERLPDGKTRRKVARSEAKMTARSTVIPLNPEMIPPGSVLSDQTISDISAGLYGVRRMNPIPAQTAPRMSYAAKLKQRAKANRLARAQSA